MKSLHILQICTICIIPQKDIQSVHEWNEEWGDE